jgi:hypothetical protein
MGARRRQERHARVVREANRGLDRRANVDALTHQTVEQTHIGWLGTRGIRNFDPPGDAQHYPFFNVFTHILAVSQ